MLGCCWIRVEHGSTLQSSVARQHRSTASQLSPASCSTARQPTTKKPGIAPAFSCPGSDPFSTKTALTPLGWKTPTEVGVYRG